MNERPTVLSCALAVIALLIGLLSPPPAMAGAWREKAAEHFDRGISYVDERDFGLAIREFERAYEISSHAGVLYNLGLAYAAVGRYRDAHRSLSTYLRDGEGELGEERLESVRSLIEQYEAKLAKLHVTTSPVDAEVLIDGERHDHGASVALDPGRHAIIARASGYLESTNEVELAVSDERTLSIQLQPLPPVSKPSQASGQAAIPTRNAPLAFDRAKPDRTLAYVFGGTAVAFGGAALGIVLHNNARFDAWKRTEQEQPPPGSTLNSEQSEVRREQEAARRSIKTWDDVAFGTSLAAAATLGLATVFWFAPPEKSSPRTGAFFGLGAGGVRGSF